MIVDYEIKESPVKICGSVSYVEQSSWIPNARIRDIILFGQPYEEEWYNKTIKACQLTTDLANLSGGDMTEIGERGINLSGGQKARVCLARAVYANRDIILMDDPISALDAHVRKEVFNEVFAGVCKNKTRILVTHAIDFAPKADRIIIMKSGRIAALGTYQELQTNELMIEILSA